MSGLLLPTPIGKSKKIAWATAVGNAFVTYDFTVYSFYAVIIGTLFFPAESVFASLLLSLITFGAGFAMRPVGAIIFGRMADSKGRRVAITASNVLMTFATACIAFAPTYATIGAAATFLIVIARLSQGLAVGGETGVSAVVMMELAERDERCYTVSWRTAGQAAAALLGALVSAGSVALLTKEQLHDWGWRIPFVLGLLIAPVGWYLRRQMIEIPAGKIHLPPLKSVIAQHRATIGFGILAMAAPTTGIYLLVYYMPLYLVRTLHLPPTVSLLSACLSSTAIIFTLPFVARIADRQTRRKPIQFLTLTTSIVSVYPVFLLLTSGVGELASLSLIAALAALLLGNNASFTVMMLEAFPRLHRATGMSIIYSFGITLFGGFCPLIVTWLINVTGNPMAPAWYLLLALSISLYAVVRFPIHVEKR